MCYLLSLCILISISWPLRGISKTNPRGLFWAQNTWKPQGPVREFNVCLWAWTSWYLCKWKQTRWWNYIPKAPHAELLKICLKTALHAGQESRAEGPGVPSTFPVNLGNIKRQKSHVIPAQIQLRNVQLVPQIISPAPKREWLTQRQGTRNYWKKPENNIQARGIFFFFFFNLEKPLQTRLGATPHTQTVSDPSLWMWNPTSGLGRAPVPAAQKLKQLPCADLVSWLQTLLGWSSRELIKHSLKTKQLFILIAITQILRVNCNEFHMWGERTLYPLQNGSGMIPRAADWI